MVINVQRITMRFYKILKQTVELKKKKQKWQDVVCKGGLND